ncbi:MAG: hypothetical protein H0X25_18540 [Acidobacteriales bacterium]|nr:hypothetical protein [Terriglobales bacterium]
MAGLTPGTDGNLYGSTFNGGPTASYGTVFKISPDGDLATLHVFSKSDGSQPVAALLIGSDGDLYGSTLLGGNNPACSCGTIFTITSTGTFTTLLDFGPGATGIAYPEGALLQDSNGIFYGTADLGGAHDSGVIFGLSLGLSFLLKHNPK